MVINNFDLPKTKLKDDELGYSYLAYYIAKIIKQAKPIENSFVIGLCGKWGDGKTTAINYIKRVLTYFIESQDEDIIEDYKTTIETIKNSEDRDENKEPVIQPFDKLAVFNFSLLLFLIILIIFLYYSNSKVIVFGRSNSIIVVTLILFLMTFKNVRNFLIEKTKSIIKHVQKNLLLEQEKVIPELIIIDFNPWHYQKQEDIIINFFKTLSKNLTIAGLNEDNELLNNLMQYSSLLTGINIPKIETSKISITEIKNNIYKELKNSKTKFLIIIDDLDRIQSGDALTVFKAVKLLADFPNIIYLLSYDDERLKKNWQFQNQGDNYIQKIVQLEKKLPTISKPKLKEIFINRIINVIEKEDAINKDRLIAVFDFAIFKLIKNIRDINRFENSFKLTFIAHENITEINILDFILISIIEELDKDAYLLIQENKEIIFDSISQIDLKKHVDFVKQIMNLPSFLLFGVLFSNYFRKLSDLIDTIVKDSKDSNKFQDVSSYDLTNLLPSIKYKFVNFQENDTFRKICDKDSFDNYFMPKISTSFLLDDEFLQLINAIKNQENFSNTFSNIFSINQDKIKDFNKRISKNSFIKNEGNIIKFIKSFLEIDDKLVSQLFSFRKFCEDQLEILKKEKFLTKTQLVELLIENSKESNIIQELQWFHELNMSNIDNNFKEDLFNSPRIGDLKNIIQNTKIPLYINNTELVEILIILGIHQITPINLDEIKTYILENDEILTLLLSRIKTNNLKYELYLDFEEIQNYLISRFIESKKTDATDDNLYFCKNVAMPILDENFSNKLAILISDIATSINICRNLNSTLNSYKSISETTNENTKDIYSKNYNQSLIQFENGNIFNKFFALSENELVLTYLLMKILSDAESKKALLDSIQTAKDSISSVNEINVNKFDYCDKIEKVQKMIKESIN